MSDIPLSKDQLNKEEKHFHHFYNLAIILSFVTMVEVILIVLPFVKGFLFCSLVVLSLVKFFTVIFIFMHLVYDKMIYTLLFVAGLILATGTVIALSVLFSPNRVDQDAISMNPETEEFRKISEQTAPRVRQAIWTSEHQLV
ncbi:MAG: cytochrome C oxidase subunit IV family protein [Opitutales bacterium]|nr:cytochrome C oxidase subunit IV family protein [Opitutales bacterium]